MTATQIAFRFGAMRNPPRTWQEVQALLGCSRATAFRWLAFVRSAGEVPMEAVAKERHQAKHQITQATP